MLSEIGMPARWVLFLIYSVLLVYYFVTIKNKMRYFKNVNKWRQYILVCIDEMVNKQNKKKKRGINRVRFILTALIVRLS